MKYVELHAASAFSFLQGASVPEEMVALCAEYGMGAMALADLNGVYGAPRFHMAAKKAKVEAHIGAEIDSSAHPLIGASATANHGSARITTDEGETPHTFRRGSTRIDADQKSIIHNQKSKMQTPHGTSAIGHVATLPLLCADRTGYQNLCQLITKMKLRVPKYGDTAASAKELEEHASGLVCLTG